MNTEARLGLFPFLRRYGWRLLLLVLLGLINGAGILVLGELRYNPVQDTTITLTAQGFSPKAVTIIPGSTITFRTERGLPFWPASDLHPSHGIYPAFDPKVPVTPTESWSFRFDTEGVWGFHDHLAPEYRGVIRVGKRTTLSSNSLAGKLLTLKHVLVPAERDPDALLAACNEQINSRGAYQECWKETFQSLLAGGTIDEALEVLGTLKNRSIEFASDCHVYAHIIGEEAYWRFRGQPKFAITQDTGNCSFGFYHGFMQEFASHEQTFDRAVAFCKIVKEELHGAADVNVSVFGSNCEHGIGHGLTYKYIIPNWGNEEKVVSLGIADCRSITGIHTMECINGVFGGIAAMYFGLHGYNLSMNMDDPFWLCHKRTPEEQPYCYDSMIPPLYQMADGDFGRVVRYIEAIPVAAGREVAMRHLGAMRGHLALQPDQYDAVLADCRELNDELHPACITGFSSQILHIGTLPDGFDRSMAFCAKMRTDAERLACYDGMGDTIDYLFSEAEKLEYCGKLTEPYAARCAKKR